MKIYLVRFHVCEPVWLVIKAKDKEHCKKFVEEWKRNSKWCKDWTYTINPCSDDKKGIIFIEEY